MKPEVMIIDDDAGLCNALSLSLEIAGFGVVMFGAFSLARREIATFRGIVLLDITMPEISGIQVLGILRKDFPRLPVIMLTGRNEVETAVLCIKQGAVDYLVKPVDDALLIAKIREYYPLQRASEHIFTPQELCARVDSLREQFRLSADKVCKEIHASLFTPEFYTNPELTLHDFAKRIGSNQKTVSMSINQTAGIGFRILLAKIRLVSFIRGFSPENGKSIKESAIEFGFQRHATLCDQCRSLLGCTPMDLFLP